MTDDERKPRFPVQRVAYVSPIANRLPRFAYSTFRPERDTPRDVPFYDEPTDGNEKS